MSTIQPDDVGECTDKKTQCITPNECAHEQQCRRVRIVAAAVQASAMRCLHGSPVCDDCKSKVCVDCQVRAVAKPGDVCDVCEFKARMSRRAGAPVSAGSLKITGSIEGGGPDSRRIAAEIERQDVSMPIDLTLLGRLEVASGVPADDWRKAQEQRRVLNDAAIAAQREAWRQGRLVDPIQLDLPIAERGIADLIRDRAALWSRRSDKWHRILNTSRAWTWRGVALPGVVGALGALAVVLNATGVLHVPAAAAWPAVGTVVTALIGLRANAARMELDAGNVEQAWVVADRMAEHYRGLVARVDWTLIGDDELDRDEVDATLAGIFYESQKLEAAARFGLPGAFAEVLSQVTR